MPEHRQEGDFEAGVMLDIGPGAGALIIFTTDELRGSEIEISPVGDDHRRTHTDVLPRKVASGYVSAAVFGSLPAGEYRLWHPTRPAHETALITSGEVTELDWR